jgi:molecular chaperone GrpE
VGAVSETDGEGVRPIDEPVPEEAAAPPCEKATQQEESGADAALAGLAGRLAKVEEQLAEFHRRAAHRESVIDRLHEENTELRSGLSRIILEPAVADLIRLYDELDRECRRLESNAENWQLMRSFADDVALILDRCGIEVFSAEPGEPFQPDRHRPLAVVPCDDQARHNTVAEVLAAGFAERESGRVRRPVQARFHRYIPTAGAAGQDGDASQSQ